MGGIIPPSPHISLRREASSGYISPLCPTSSAKIRQRVQIGHKMNSNEMKEESCSNVAFEETVKPTDWW